ncbi:hypothetical protein [Xenorhabdus cabanillasii]|uniref:Uncharacterized protein n=2 Tax=Xenorhabdus cabanillasii TaxID=351673 RepID=W1IT67_9GAMM|nr:hypothetical protein Xcab_04159 [Xenorhabdus cabanillasii JM26]CDL80395.1 hypothetical protein XCR1_150006 [Xenorhabdus cabanillasii JM26]
MNNTSTNNDVSKLSFLHTPYDLIREEMDKIFLQDASVSWNEW